MRAFCESNKVRLITPEKPWSAIARGAVLYGLHPKSLVDCRKCRQSYGIRVHRMYDPEVDDDVDENDILNCPVNGKRVRNCMKWHVKKVRTLLIDGAA